MGAQIESAESEFLGELKQGFERAIDLRKNLDNKSNTMITIAGAISTLLLAIATFLITKIQSPEWIYNTSIAILFIGLILAVVSITFFVKSFSLKKYYYVIGPKKFFENGKYNEKLVEQFTTASKEDFTRHLIEEYLKGIKNFYELNSKKADDIKWGQILLVSSISSVGLLLAFVLLSTIFGPTKII